MKSAIALALGAVAGSAVADDVLYSKYANHLHKRSINDEGQWNVCKFTRSLYASNV